MDGTKRARAVGAASPPRHSLLDLEPAPESDSDARIGRAPLLIIGVGNPSRGDDAIGPLLLQRLGDELSSSGAGTQGAEDQPLVELLGAYQLQPEHVLDLRGRRRVIIVDAAASGPTPFAVSAVTPDPRRAFSTHSLSPAALAAVHQRLYGDVPPLELLAIRGARFELGDPLTTTAAANLDAAQAWLRALVAALAPDADADNDKGANRARTPREG